MINIYTDSCSDIGQEEIQKKDINIIPLQVFINERTYRDGVDIHTQDLFEFVNKRGELPKTSAPSVGDFTKVFSQDEGDGIFIGIGSKLSATIQNATLAAELLKEKTVKIIDSQNLSTGIGLLVLKASDFKSQGKSLEEIESEIESRVNKVHTSFVIDNLDYLYKGGRCSAMANIVGSLLKIRPVIEVRKDGTLGVREKTRGARSKALGVLIKDFQDNLPDIDLDRVFITHTGCDEDAAYLAEELNKLAKIKELLITVAGATIASHCGPDTIGVLYLTK